MLCCCDFDVVLVKKENKNKKIIIKTKQRINKRNKIQRRKGKRKKKENNKKKTHALPLFHTTTMGKCISSIHNGIERLEYSANKLMNERVSPQHQLFDETEAFEINLSDRKIMKSPSQFRAQVGAVMVLVTVAECTWTVIWVSGVMLSEAPGEIVENFVAVLALCLPLISWFFMGAGITEHARDDKAKGAKSFTYLLCLLKTIMALAVFILSAFYNTAILTLFVIASMFFFNFIGTTAYLCFVF